MIPSQVTLHEGDCLEVMGGMAANSVDTVLCDPPYSLEFMGKDWDKSIPGIPYWKEMLRVAKPGAMLMAFGGTRTHHRLMCAIEDAGWIIRDVVMWVYGSGFPKSHNIGKAIDKTAIVVCPSCYGNKKKRNPDAKEWEEYWLDEPCPECEGIGKITGAERENTGNLLPGHSEGRNRTFGTNGIGIYGDAASSVAYETIPATPAAATWEGYGTNLKPAYEPIILAMKPLDGTFAQNALKWGVAGLWIDGGRVGVDPGGADDKRLGGNGQWNIKREQSNHTVSLPPKKCNSSVLGRWPANLIHDGSEEVLAGFPDSKGWSHRTKGQNIDMTNVPIGGGQINATYGDSGSAARYFYCAKASRKERNAGLEGMEEREARRTGISDPQFREARGRKPQKLIETNHHPTVKPLALMRHLCRLSRTPSGGVVLDPFMGSGSTGCAAILEDRSFIGIDKETEYVEIARRRIAHAVKEVKQRQPTLGI